MKCGAEAPKEEVPVTYKGEGGLRAVNQKERIIDFMKIGFAASG